MYHDGWLMAQNKLSTIGCATNGNNKILFFSGHNSHFDDRSMTTLKHHCVKPFVLKADNSGNTQEISNGSNTYPESLYNKAKISSTRVVPP